MKRALLILAAGCGSFQDPNIVVDLRVISMDATVPEQVIDIDLANPPPVAQILQRSSNIGADEIGMKLGAKRFDYWVHRFGFGAQTAHRAGRFRARFLFWMTKATL